MKTLKKITLIAVTVIITFVIALCVIPADKSNGPHGMFKEQEEQIRKDNIARGKEYMNTHTQAQVDSVIAVNN